MGALALVALLLLSRRSSSASSDPTPEPTPAPAPAAEPKADPSKTLDEVVGGVAGTVGAVGAAAGIIGKGVAGIKSAATAFGQGLAAVGVSGFAVVLAAWGVVITAAAVFAAIIAPEINRRRTVPAWLTSEPWGFAWRASRDFWLRSIERRTSGLIRLVYRWVDGDGRFGDLNVQGELVFLSPVDGGAPGDRFAFYDALAWARSRPRIGVSELAIIEDGAHLLALTYGRAFLATSRTIARLSGQAGVNREPLAPLAAESLTPTGQGTVNPPTSVEGVSVRDIIETVKEGCAAGIGVARVSYGAADVWLLESVSRAALAREVAGELRASGFPWVTFTGGEVVFGVAGGVQMPGGQA